MASCNASFVVLATLSIMSITRASSLCFKAIYSFGDSLADTGNQHYVPPVPRYRSLKSPYGRTFFHQPTGRWSDGRLVIDFFAERVGIPLLKPYMGIRNGKIQDWNPQEGMNFAFGGASALDPTFFAAKGIHRYSNYSLTVQLGWFLELLPSICNSSSGCKEVLGSSLFFVGEIGGNDFNFALTQNNNVEEIMTYVPFVISEISSAINKLIDLGAQTLVVPGDYPVGCNYMYLLRYHSTDMYERDQAGCLKSLNKFAEYYNEQLIAELERLRKLHPHTNIIYADFYNAALRMYQSPTQFGFKESILKACCGRPNSNNFSEQCGNPGANVCDEPAQYISWDGLHFTEAAYETIAQGLLDGPYTDPKIRISCDSEI